MRKSEFLVKFSHVACAQVMAYNKSHSLNVLGRWKLRVKHGVMKENHMFEALRRYPPPPPYRRVKGPLPEIVLPTDALEEKYRRKAEKERPLSPLFPVTRPEKDPARYFAYKQLEWMQKEGLDEKEAAERVVAGLEAERNQAADKALSLAKEVANWRRRGGQAPECIPLAEWTAYSSRMEATSFVDWPRKAVFDLDSWIVVKILGLDWRIERIFDEEAAILETDEPDEEKGRLAVAVFRLRKELFQPDIEDRLLDRIDAVKDNFYFDKEALESADEDPEFERLQQRAEARGLDDWSGEEVRELDEWIVKNFREEKTMVVFNPQTGENVDPELPVERLRLEIFPELCATYQRLPNTPQYSLGGDLFATEEEGEGSDSSKVQPSSEEEDADERKKRLEATTFYGDGSRVANVRSMKTPDKIMQTFARHGIYPNVNVLDFVEKVRKIKKRLQTSRLPSSFDADDDEDDDIKHIELSPEDEATVLQIPDDFLDNLIDDRQPGSYAQERLKYTRNGLRTQRFMERIFAKSDGPPPEDVPLDVAYPTAEREPEENASPTTKK